MAVSGLRWPSAVRRHWVVRGSRSGCGYSFARLARSGESRRHRKAVGIERVPHQPHQRGMLIVGEVKIRHSGDMGSRSRRAALYHGPGASPPMRMTTSWLGSKRTCRIQVWWREAAPQWRAPLGLIPRTRRSSRSPSPVIIPPRAQVSKPAPGLNWGRCENTSDAKRQAAKLR